MVGVMPSLPSLPSIPLIPSLPANTNETTSAAIAMTQAIILINVFFIILLFPRLTPSGIYADIISYYEKIVKY